jgi:hypothetical protein
MKTQLTHNWERTVFADLVDENQTVVTVERELAQAPVFAIIDGQSIKLPVTEASRAFVLVHYIGEEGWEVRSRHASTELAIKNALKKIARNTKYPTSKPYHARVADAAGNVFGLDY